MRFKPSRLLVLKILEAADRFEWSWQGFGMFRLYLSREVRLHVWLPDTARPHVHTLHTHPWDFESKIILGTIADHRYRIVSPLEAQAFFHSPTTIRNFIEQEIICGPGGGCTPKKPRSVILRGPSITTYPAGSKYTMRAPDPMEIHSGKADHMYIHATVAEPGTVSIIKRTFHEDTERAFVYHPEGTEWISAEPRPATAEEVRDMAKRTLSFQAYREAKLDAVKP